MPRPHYLLSVLILLFTLLTSACAPLFDDQGKEEVSPVFRTAPYRIALLPLDSRPACTSLVSHLGTIGNIDVRIPPQELLDHYHTPADRTALRSWLQEEAKHTDTLIISADMLLHGSLLRSRKNDLTDEDISSALTFLHTLRQDNPTIQLYVFSTIPRLLIADDTATAKYQKAMLKYSTLQEEILLFSQEDLLDELHELEEDIPSEILDDYHRLYERNLTVNLGLLSLVEDHTIDYLMIGQDDGHVFGMPNIVKDHLDRQIRHNPQLADRTQIVRGADELAMLLVSRIHGHSLAPLSVYVAYNDEKAGGTIMPFMSQSVNTTVNEKIASINARRTDCPDDADFVLYVYIGNDTTDVSLPQNALHVLRSLDADDRPIALVDLSEHFRASETVFPTLLNESFPLHRLIAYAGWNTASNAIGTAVAEAGIYANALKSASDEYDQLASVYANLIFLNDRFLDDYYYMKLVQPYLKLRLSALSNDPYRLSMQSYYEANDWLSRAMQNQANILSSTDAYRAPFRPTMTDLTDTFRITSLTVDVNLPWERIFEANITSKIFIKNLQKTVDIYP